MNKENYKKAIDQIHPSEELKQKTLEKMEKSSPKRIPYIKFVATCAAMVLMVCVIGQTRLFEKTIDVIEDAPIAQVATKEKNSNLPRFESMEELKAAIKENREEKYFATNGIFDMAESAVSKGDVALEESVSVDNSNSLRGDSSSKDFSTTNVQVENVDEADIVKTDGDYIYHVTDNKVLIIKSDTLENIFTIDGNLNSEETQKNFSMSEIFINDDMLVILGNEYEYEEIKTQTNVVEEVVEFVEDMVVSDVARISSTQTAKAKVYDISDKTNPVLKREIGLEGHYSNSRMIGDYVYFISNKNAYYTTLMNDYEILPKFSDTAVSDKRISINYSDIAYFEGTNNYNYTLVAGFNIKNQEEIALETFLGASETVYASEKNLYMTQVTYDYKYYRATKSIIYKFNLEDGQIALQCKGEVNGDLNNQFSMDEYDGKLRIATTAYNEEWESTNQLYVLDEELKEIGKIENLAVGEKIYAVRFIGKIGYVVTFKEIDPLFVIDLSNPTNPQVKGELKIPGYSSYLHPYDETHIIGIGYNTKSNGYGGITNDNMKMSMFDVSDLENPKEMFSIDIGNGYTYSEITYNHKALFYNPSRNLIGFPVTTREYDYYNDKNNFILFKIDLENGFEEYGRISQKISYRTNINRAIYIDNMLYTLSESKMMSYDLNTMEKQSELVYFEEDYSEDLYWIEYETTN